MTEAKKKKATDLYFRVKRLILFAEETTPEYKDYLQPPFELNRAFDHLNRALSVEQGIKVVDNSEEYIEDNLNKTLGHLYRAFFDVADWVAMNLREAVQTEYAGFSHECIQSVIPDYYKDLRPAVDKACKEIAAVRDGKDVSDLTTHELMERYEEILLGLFDDITKIKSKKGGVIDCEARVRGQRKKDIAWKIAIGLICAAAGALLKTLLG